MECIWNVCIIRIKILRRGSDVLNLTIGDSVQNDLLQRRQSEQSEKKSKLGDADLVQKPPAVRRRRGADDDIKSAPTDKGSKAITVGTLPPTLDPLGDSDTDTGDSDPATIKPDFAPPPFKKNIKPPKRVLQDDEIAMVEKENTYSAYVSICI